MVMLACDLTTAGRPVIGRSGFREQDSSRAGRHESAVAAPGSASLKPQPTGQSGRLRPVCPPLGASARLYGSPPHPPLALTHPLYSYLPGRHMAPRYGWSV